MKMGQGSLTEWIRFQEMRGLWRSPGRTCPFAG